MQVIRTKHESKARGFGFVSFLDPMDCAKAIREQNGKYLGSRPMKITKSSWDDRNIKEVKKKEAKKRKLQESLGLA
jgi:RNA recognition motif-containing protein